MSKMATGIYIFEAPICLNTLIYIDTGRAPGRAPGRALGRALGRDPGEGSGAPPWVEIGSSGGSVKKYLIIPPLE